MVAVERLETRVKVAARHVVVDLHGDIHLHAAKRIDDLLEPVEVDLGVMGYVNAGEIGNSLDRKGRPADGMGCVDLVLAVLAHVDERVTVDGNERDLLFLRIDAREHNTVAAELVSCVLAGRLALARPVHAHEQYVERLARHIGSNKRVAQSRIDACMQLVADVLVEGERGSGATEA